MPEKHENEMSQVKQKSKKVLNVKKEIPADVKPSCLELPYTAPLESKQRRNLPTKIPLPTTLTSGSKPRNSQKTKGTSKLVDSRPPALAKFLPNSQELGNTSSSEGEKDSPPPEWDSVPVHKPGSCKYGAPHSRSASGSGRENCRASCQQRRPRVCVPEPVCSSQQPRR